MRDKVTYPSENLIPMDSEILQPFYTYFEKLRQSLHILSRWHIPVILPLINRIPVHPELSC